MSKQTFVIVSPSLAGARPAHRLTDADTALTEIAAGTETSARSGKDAPPSDCRLLWPRRRAQARVDDIVRALRRHGVLTRARLVELCGAARWSDSGSPRARARAGSSGTVRQLGDDLHEHAEPSIR